MHHGMLLVVSSMEFRMMLGFFLEIEAAVPTPNTSFSKYLSVP